LKQEEDVRQAELEAERLRLEELAK